MLSIKALRAGYGGGEVLKGVDAAVGNGELVAFIGPNGAGKSTLLKSVFGLCEIHGGSIKLDGRELVGVPSHELVGLGIGLVPQGRQIFGEMTVEENLKLAGFAIGMEAMLDGISHAYLQFPFLKDKKDHRASTLSGGQQQLLAFASALVSRPRLLLLDEPSMGLAPKTAKEIFASITAINKSGTQVVLVEQNARRAVAIADRTYVLEDGHVAMSGGREILNDERIASIYLGGE